MMAISVGKKIPAFKLPATGDQQIRLSDLKGKKLVLYFYPKDSTPGCTRESQEFGENYKKFQKLGAEILGVSRDSVKSHEKFKDKYGFPFELLSDEEEELCQKFDVIKEKNMYGKKVMGIERSTFVIDEQGKLVKEWRKVKVDGHVDEVLSFLQENK
jgi:thioredoxin-dependent peroxiredoxin